MNPLSAFNGLQRLLGLGLTGMAVGVTFTSLLQDLHLGNPRVRTAFGFARIVAVATSILTFVVGLHMASLTFSATLMDYMVQVPEMGVYLVCTLLCHQLFFFAFSYLLAYRIKSILPWAGNRPRFVASFMSVIGFILLVPSITMVVAVVQTSNITDFLVNYVYNRLTKAALAIQSCLLGAISVTTDLTILVRLRSHRRLLFNGHGKADRAIRRIHKQMLIVSINSFVTLAELAVRIVAVFSSYLGLDTYVKALAIAVDIHSFCHMGVTIEDVLRTPASSSGCLPPGVITATGLISSNSQGKSRANTPGGNAMVAGANGATMAMSPSLMHHALSSLTSAMFRSLTRASTPSTVHRHEIQDGPENHGTMIQQPRSQASASIGRPSAGQNVAKATQGHSPHAIVVIAEEGSDDCGGGDGT